MDTQSKDILKQLLERLDNQQNKLDRVMGRLDTLQNIIERQNQKQNLLDEKLVEMTIKREQEIAVMTEQLQTALQEIVEPFHAIDSQRVSTPLAHTTAQPLQNLGMQIGDKLRSIADRTVDTAQKSHQLTSWSRKMEDKMTELAANSVEMTTFLLEMRSVKDLIKGQTNSELIWLNNQIDKKLSDIGSVVRDIHQQQTEVNTDNVRSKGQVVKTVMQHVKQQGHTNETLSDEPKSKGLCDKQTQVIQDLERKIEQINSSVLEVPREIKTYLDTILRSNTQSIKDLENKHFEALLSELQLNSATAVAESETHTCKIISAAETAKEDLKKIIQTEGDSSSKIQVELGNIHTLIDSIVVSIQGHMTTVGNKIDSTEASMLNRHATMRNKLEELTSHTAVNATLKKVTSGLKDYICMTKREIFAVTEKEAQIVRDRIEGPLPCPGKYTFDFYVTNFKTLVRSGKHVDSLPWHINEMQTCVTGIAIMSKNGEMEVWLLYGRHPREVGLQPRSGKTLKVKATICDIYKKKLEPLDIGEETITLSEAAISTNSRSGCKIGVTSCDVLLERKYGEQEGYWQGALLIRCEVTVQ